MNERVEYRQRLSCHTPKSHFSKLWSPRVRVVFIRGKVFTARLTVTNGWNANGEYYRYSFRLCAPSIQKGNLTTAVRFTSVLCAHLNKFFTAFCSLIQWTRNLCCFGAANEHSERINEVETATKIKIGLCYCLCRAQLKQLSSLVHTRLLLGSQLSSVWLLWKIFFGILSFCHTHNLDSIHKTLGSLI